tara:strand:+ start:414 stop:851 length:438 start_codon:yes stop_codon:yes gene_type:complete
MKLLIKPLNDLAKKYYSKHNHFHKGDAGLDLYILKDQTIKAGETVKIKLGISCENIDGKGYLLFPRSSISKTPLRLANSIGLIDWGYRGEIMAVCDNIKDYDFSISKGDRLFQIVSSDMSSIEFEIANELSETTRGSGGFGSTGS